MTHEEMRNHDGLIDKLWKREQVSDDLLWDAFWEMTEADARTYCQDRWFNGRRVNQNHITRKLKRWYPQVQEACERKKVAIRSDPTHPKAYRCQNWSASHSYTLCWVSATSREEAARLFDLFLPVVQDEMDNNGNPGGRHIDLPEILPAQSVEARVMSGNAEVLAALNLAAQDRRKDIARRVKQLETQMSLIEGRMDAISMFISTTTSNPVAQPESADEEASE